VAAGKNSCYWTYGSNGKYRYVFTGSNRWVNDSICAARDPGMAKIP
jgi:hypothetical protein